MRSIDTGKDIALGAGVSSGIGAVYADWLAKRGHDQILVARDVGKVGSLASRMRSATGRDVNRVAAEQPIQEAPTEWDDWKSVRDVY